MNKTKFKKVMSLYKDGVEPHSCVMVILQMCSKDGVADLTFHRDTALWIDKFYNVIRFYPGTEMEEL